MKSYFEAMKTYIQKHPPNFGDGESVLSMLYECYNENNPCPRTVDREQTYILRIDRPVPENLVCSYPRQVVKNRYA